jgi:hypothetical protein
VTPRDPVPLGEALGEAVVQAGGAKLLAIQRAWRCMEGVPPDTVPVMLKGEELVVACGGPGALRAVLFREKELLGRIAEVVGGAGVSRLVPVLEPGVKQGR